MGIQARGRRRRCPRDSPWRQDSRRLESDRIVRSSPTAGCWSGHALPAGQPGDTGPWETLVHPRGQGASGPNPRTEAKSRGDRISIYTTAPYDTTRLPGRGNQPGLDPMIRTPTAPSIGISDRVAARRNRSADLSVLAPVDWAIDRCPRTGRARQGAASPRPRDGRNASERPPGRGDPGPRATRPLSLSGRSSALNGRAQFRISHKIVRRHETVWCPQAIVTSGVAALNIHRGCAR